MKFSVLLPTRNRLELLSRAVETVRRQEHGDWEIVVSDNQSEEDVGSYVRSLEDERVRYFRTDTFVPVTENWNNAIDRCTGDYIIMLGDDDGLMPGYFSYLEDLIERYESPEFIYTNAFLYAYPGVIPSLPEGFLRTYSKRSIFHGADEPFWLDQVEARALVDDSLGFRVTFDYNMQFSLISRGLVERMRPYGDFFQSPYPDYYATNAMMLIAERILVAPRPVVVVGISPKSFGYFYFNDAEASGNEFLKNLPDPDMAAGLRDVLLPGSSMNDSWLYAMVTLECNFAAQGIRVDRDRYRAVQIMSVYARLLAGDAGAGERLALLHKRMRPGERLKYGLLLDLVTRIAPPSQGRHWFARLDRAWGSHPEHDMPFVRGRFDTIVDVFDRVEPSACVEVMGER